MVYPNSNLPAASQPWGKAIQRDLETMQKTIDSNEVNNKARDAQLMAAQQRLANQISAVEQVALAAAQASAAAASAAATAATAATQANDALSAALQALTEVGAQSGTSSNSGSWSIVGPSSSFGATQVLSVTVTNPGSYTSVSVSASVTFHASAELTGQAASGTFYIGDGSTNNGASGWSIPTGSGTYPKTNTYSQSYSNSYANGSSKTIYLYVSSSSLPSDMASIDATVSVSATWS